MQCPFQSLLHELNNCSVVLNQRRYDNRHNTVLARIKTTIESHRNNYLLIANLPECPYNRPNFLASDPRPDIVMWSTDQKKCYFIHLTVCFNTISDKAVDRKLLRYAELSEYIESSRYVCKVLPLQVGSRGFIDMNSFSPLQVLMKMKKKAYDPFLKEIAKDAIIESFQIWSRRNCDSRFLLLLRKLNILRIRVDY